MTENPQDTMPDFIKLVGEELIKLEGSDKTMHFSASYGICTFSEHFDPNKLSPSSICIMKAILESFRIGIRKECEDAGKSFELMDKYLSEMLFILHKVYDEYKKNGLDAEKHDGDLLADLAGIGTYVVNQSLRNLSPYPHDN